MFLVTYSERTNQKWENKTKTFPTLPEAKKAVNESMVREDFNNHRIWMPQGSENLDYKEKFEELYDYILKGAGIRESKNKKTMI